MPYLITTVLTLRHCMQTGRFQQERLEAWILAPFNPIADRRGILPA